MPVGLEILLESPTLDVDGEPSGDPVYGHVLNTAGSDGVSAEGTVTVHYDEISGYFYPDGEYWQMRVPHYQLASLNRGPLAPTTVIKPRLAPALYGMGLLEAVTETAVSLGYATYGGSPGRPAWHLREGSLKLGRFGWQADAVSIRDQTARAFAREMGLTSPDRPRDDCTPVEVDCVQQPPGSAPEVSEELLEAVVAFVRTLPVPRAAHESDGTSLGARLFVEIGCASCHRPQLALASDTNRGTRAPRVIAAYTDLRLHDLGKEMADETMSGKRVISRWRTAPLWGLGYRLKTEFQPTFLHDGRALSTQEAILWHAGEGAPARRRYMELGTRSRSSLLEWLETL